MRLLVQEVKSKMSFVFLDTSALINKAYVGIENCYTSSTVLAELEEIKKSKNREENLKAAARQVIHDIVIKKNINMFMAEPKKVHHFIKKHELFDEINDHKILAEAYVLAEELGTFGTFITSDGALFALAKAMTKRSGDLNAVYFELKEEQKEEYLGWRATSPTDLEMISLYSHPETNILNAKINEYIKIIDDGKIKDVVRWNGESYTQLKYKGFNSSFGERIEPRNIEQKMLFDLLQNKDIKVKLCIGNYGTGKTFLMLAHALWMVQKEEFDKIIYVRNNIRVKDTDDLGAMPGSMLEKMSAWLAPLQSHLGIYTMEEMINQNVIEPLPLNFIRGLDAKRTIIFADECEDMTAQHIQLLIGRLGEGSELFLAGDLKQTDREVFEKNSGIRHTIEKLKSNPLFGMVKLIKSERSAASALADLLD